jgi:hypothetical protein
MLAAILHFQILKTKPGKSSILRAEMEWLFSREGVGKQHCRHPQVLGILHAEPRRMGHKRYASILRGPREMRGHLRMTAEYAARKKARKSPAGFPARASPSRSIRCLVCRMNQEIAHATHEDYGRDAP